MSKGYFWYYINVYIEERNMRQVFATNSFKTKEEAKFDAEIRLELLPFHHAELHIMHYDKSHFNDYNEDPIEIQPNKKGKQMKNEQYCGNCCWLVGEDHDGYGKCAKIFGHWVNCSDKCWKKELFISKKAMRHYLAVLIQHNRWRRDNEIPNSRKPVDVRELGKAIDFAVDYCKTFMKI